MPHSSETDDGGHGGHTGSAAGVADPVSPGRRRVLVVDDNADLRELVGTVLSAGGYEVADAPHGRAALDLVTDFRPDVILLDSAMPVMSGPEFAQRYHRLPAPHAPIVMLTGEPDGRAQAAAIGAAAFLAKPFALPALLRHVGAAGCTAACAS